MANMNVDVISEILEHLWLLHGTGWDSEFRPEASRRFFSNYSQISKLWTLAAQRYVYRHAYLRWANDWSSFQEGMKNPERGSFLRKSVRILNLHVSHSRMGIPVQKLDSILSLCPNLVELRLSTGPEINTLFLKQAQKSRLRASIEAIKPTLRALQLHIDGRCKKSQVLKQIGELIPFSTLDFLVISSNESRLPLPILPPQEWDVRHSCWTPIQWPLETNADTISLKDVLNQPKDEPNDLPPIYPHTIRFNSSEVRSWDSPHLFLNLLGSRLERVMFQTDFSDGRWNTDLETITSSCPKLEQMAVIDCIANTKRTHLHPRLYVLEPEDWHVDQEEDASTSEDETTSTPSPSTRIMGHGDFVKTASHMVCFVENVSKTWIEKKNPFEFRNELVFDPRWLQEAVTGQSEIRSDDELRGMYPWIWSDALIDRQAQYMVALRRPSTLEEDLAL